MTDKPTVKINAPRVFGSEEEMQEYIDSLSDGNNEIVNVSDFSELPETVQDAIRTALSSGIAPAMASETESELKKAGVTMEDLVKDLRKAAGMDN